MLSTDVLTEFSKNLIEALEAIREIDNLKNQMSKIASKLSSAKFEKDRLSEEIESKNSELEKINSKIDKAKEDLEEIQCRKKDIVANILDTNKERIESETQALIDKRKNEILSETKMYQEALDILISKYQKIQGEAIEASSSRN